jgi:hypothetical protein
MRQRLADMAVKSALPEDMMRNAAIVAAFVYHTAMRSEKLPRKPVKSVIASGGSN